jgi:thiol-disulfide isomerase/thioredoxin
MQKSIAAILWALLLMLHNVACLAGTILKGQVIALDGKLPTTVYLNSFEDRGHLYPIPLSAYGDFSFQIESRTPGLYFLQAGNASSSFFITPAEDVIRVHMTLEKGNLKDGGVDDSPENIAFYDFTRLAAVYDDRLKKILTGTYSDIALQHVVTEYNQALSQFQQTYKGTYTANVLAQMRKIKAEALVSLNSLRENFFANVPLGDSSILSNPVFDKMLTFYMSYLNDTSYPQRKNFITGITTSAHSGIKVYKYVAQTLFENFVTDNREAMMLAYMEWFNHSADTVLLPVLKEKVSRLQKVMPGGGFVDLTFIAPDSTKLSLSKTVAANKLTLLFIWESNCHHCREAIPEITKLYNTYHKQGFEVFAVALNEEQSDWKKYISENRLAWKNTCVCGAEQTTLEKYYVTTTPTLVLINQEGIIEHRLIEVKDLQKNIEPLLKPR